MDNKTAVKRWLWYFSIPAAAILLFKLFDNISQAIGTLATLVGILSPFVGGFILAFFLYGPCCWIEKKLLKLKGKAWKKLARPLSLLIVYLVLFCSLALLIYSIIPLVVSSLTSLLSSMPEYMQTAAQRIEEISQPGGALERLGLSAKLNELYRYFQSALTKLLTTENIVTAIKGVGNVATSLFNVVISFIVSLYMLSSRESLFREVRAVCGLFIKRRPLAILRRYANRSAAIFISYFYGAFADAFAVGVVVSIGLLIFKIPYAVLLGMTMGMLNMIPYFGAVIGGVLVVLTTLLTSNIYTAIGVLIYLIVVQQIDANILQPRVVGNSVGLRPIYVLLSITLFGGIFGFWGIFFGVPMMAVIQMLVKDAIANQRRLQERKRMQSPEGSSPEQPAPHRDRANRTGTP